MNLFTGNITNLERALDYSALKQKVVADNIANADVPNFKSKSVSFKNVMNDTISQVDSYRSDPRHYKFTISDKAPSVYTNKNMQYHHNGNNVDVDKEMSELATNQIYYQALVERMNGQFSTLQNVIKGGR